MTLVGRSATADRVRANSKFWLTLNLLLATLVVLLGGVMRFIDRSPKVKRSEPLARLERNLSPGRSFSLPVADLRIVTMVRNRTHHPVALDR